MENIMPKTSLIKEKNKITVETFNSSVSELISKIDELLVSQASSKHKRIDELKELRKELVSAQNHYNQVKKVYNHMGDHKELINLSNRYIKSCKESIFKHQDKIMVSSGFKDQISSAINTFIEKYFGSKPKLKVQDSEFKDTLKGSFSYLKRFRKLKDEFEKDDRPSDSLDGPKP